MSKTINSTNNRMKSMVRALRYRNYQLYFIGQIVSLIGTWMQQVAMTWLVYRLTNSALLLGVVGFANQFPSFLLSPFAGVLSDRWNRHRILVITQTLSMLQAFALAALALTGKITIPYILIFGILLGFVNAFDITARQSFVVDLVEQKEDLANAIALNSSMVNAARLLGPSLAGILIAILGEGPCFLINGISYVAVLMALLAIKLKKPVVTVPHQKSILPELKEGFLYTFGFAPIKSLILLLALISFMGMPLSVLMPVFATKILQGGPSTLGYLMAASGVGALCGTLYLAAQSSVIGMGRKIVMACLIFGLGLIGFAFSHNIWLSSLCVFVTGAGMMVEMAASNTVLQTIVDDDKRGRVMSFYTMAFMGMAPFGSLLAGSLAEHIGAPNTVIISGISCIIGGIVFGLNLPNLRAVARPVLVRMGIIPEVALGLQVATEVLVPPEK